MIDWQSFHFIRPEWLYAIIPLLIVALLFKRFKQSSSGWQQVLPSHLHARLLQGEHSAQDKKHGLPVSWLIVAWILSSIALAGPTWERLPQPVYNVKQGSVLVLDMSLSMRATDLSPDRLTRARFKAIDLVNQLTDGEVGMVAYAGDAFIISPLTEDANNLVTLIPSISPEIMPIPGSEPLRGFEVATELLINAGYKTGNIYWFTDGIDRSQYQALASLSEASPFAIHTLMVGTQDGAPIRQVNGELLKDSRGAIVIPKSSPRELRAVSSRSNGEFSRISADDSDIRHLLSSPSLGDETLTQQNEDDLLQGDVWQDMGVYLVILLLPIAAYAFRRGLIMLVVMSLTLSFTTVLIPQTAYAQETSEAKTENHSTSWYQRLFNTPDQLGQQAFEQKHYDAAAERFDDPMWQGASHYRNQDFEAALEAFQLAEGIEADYNQGNALAQLGQLEEAIAAYDKVLEQQPDHQRASENKALLEQLKQEQEQQDQDQSGDSQDSEQQDQNESSDQDNNQQQSDDSQQSGNESEEEQQSQGESESSDPSEQESSAAEDAEMRDNQQPEEQGESAEQQQSESEQQAVPENQTDAETTQQSEAQLDSAEPTDEPLTDEQKEQLQRMQNLLRKVPDDPAFLLQRKMQLENQNRLRDRAPPQNRKNW